MAQISVKQIPLSRGFFSLVDDADYDAVMASGPWYTHVSHGNYYARRFVSKKVMLGLHAFLLGPVASGNRIVHLNHDGLDNRRENLREATYSQWMSLLPIGPSNTTGFKGVQHHGKRYKATCAHKYVGVFSTREEAALAYDAAARIRHGEFAALNFPLPGETSARPLVFQRENEARFENRHVIGSSGYKGVSKSGDTWMAKLGMSDGSRAYLGTFSNPEDAARAWDKEALRVRGPGTPLNFPDEN